MFCLTICVWSFLFIVEDNLGFFKGGIGEVKYKTVGFMSTQPTPTNHCILDKL